MNPKTIGILLQYTVGDFIFDFWQLLLMALFCLVNVLAISWSYRTRLKNRHKEPLLQLSHYLVAFGLSVLLYAIDAGTGQAIMVFGSLVGLVLWRNSTGQSQPFFLYLLSVAVGALVGLQFFLVALLFTAIASLTLLFQKRS